MEGTILNEIECIHIRVFDEILCADFSGLDRLL
jgi:hypothetical protein